MMHINTKCNYLKEKWRRLCWRGLCLMHTSWPLMCTTHGYVALCFVSVRMDFGKYMYRHVWILLHWRCVWFPLYQWSHIEGYGKVDMYKAKSKHNKARLLPKMPWWRHQMVNSPHNSQWRGALMLSLICAWINCWVNNCEAGDLRRHRAH